MLEVFGGCCRMAWAFLLGGWRTESLELERSRGADALSTKMISMIIRRIRNGELGMVWLGIPCSSWSRARRGKPGGKGFPPPLRGDSPEDILGLEGLSVRDQARVAAGNKMARWVARIFRECVRASIPVVIENPRSSRLWICPYMQRLPGAPLDFSHCQFEGHALMGAQLRSKRLR